MLLFLIYSSFSMNNYGLTLDQIGYGIQAEPKIESRKIKNNSICFFYDLHRVRKA